MWEKKNEFNLVEFQLMKVLWYLLSSLIKATSALGKFLRPSCSPTRNFYLKNNNHHNNNNTFSCFLKRTPWTPPATAVTEEGSEVNFSSPGL